MEDHVNVIVESEDGASKQECLGDVHEDSRRDILYVDDLIKR